MRRTRLNLGTLRRAGVPPALSPTAGDYLDDPKRQLSRRKFLTVAGLAAATGSTAVKRTGGVLAGQYTVAATDDRIVFSLNGTPRWTIDTHMFGGDPALSIDRSNGTLRIALTNALWPGTELPADFTCTITAGVTDSKMTYRAALGGFRGTVKFEQWLLGLAALRGTMALSNVPACTLGRTGALALNGRARAQFHPSWVFAFEGTDVASLTGRGDTIASARLTLALGAPGAASILRTPPSRRTIVRMERGESNWTIVPAIAGADDWKLDAQANAFDTITIEAGIDASGAPRRALMAEAPDAPGVAFRPAAYRGGDGALSRVPLRGARYAESYYPDREDAALVASFADTPVWMHAPGMSIELADAPDARFEAFAIDGAATGLRCEPSLARVTIPFDEAIIEPVHAAPGTMLAYSGGVFKPKAATEKISQQAAAFNLHVQNEGGIISMSAQTPMMVLRPKDLLYVGFTFDNLQIQSGGAGATITVIDPKNDASIIAWLPPQNIGEEAFFEIGPPPITPDPKDPDGSTGDQKLPVPPVRARLAGWSRISFLVYTPYVITYDDVDTSPTTIAPSNLVVSQMSSHAFQQYVLGGVGGLGGAGGGTGGGGGTPMVSKLNYRSYLATTGKVNIANPPATGNVTPQIPNTPPIIEFSMKGLLDWTKYVMKVAPNALPANPSQKALDKHPIPQKPKTNETAIEAPYRMIISPDRFGVWVHSLEAVDQGGKWTELWHTRLAYRMPDGTPFEGDTDLKIIRAIWTPDMSPDVSGKVWGKSDNVPFRMSLTPRDRSEIVVLSSYFSGGAATMVKQRAMKALPVKVEQLMLTSLGAWMGLHGQWPDIPPSLSVEEWRHRGTMGRDHYVKVVYKGYHWPFGHRASLVKVTERKFQPTPKGDMAAYLRQRMYIVIREPLKTYDLVPNQGREMPFSSVRITTTVTPNIDDPANPASQVYSGQTAFWVRVHGEDFMFHLVGTDHGGNTTEFTAPLIFCDNTIAHNGGSTQPLAKYVKPAYDPTSPSDTKGTSRVTREMRGSKIAFAAPKKPGDTAYDTQTIAFTGIVRGTAPSAAEGDVPSFYPAMATADVKIATVAQLTGKEGAAKIKFNQNYFEKGFGQGEVFAELVDAVKMTFTDGPNADKSGGLSTPNMDISGLSRLTGIVGGDVSKMAAAPGTNADFDPSVIFSALNGAKILGAVPLGEIVKALAGDLFQSALEKLPRFLNSFRFPVPDPIDPLLQKLIDFMDEAIPKLEDPVKSQVSDWRDKLKALKDDLASGDPSKIATVPDKVQDLMSEVMKDITSDAALLTSVLSNPEELLKLLIPDTLSIHFDWRPEVKNWPSSDSIFVVKNPTDTLWAGVKFEKKLDLSSPPTLTVGAYLQNVEIHLLPALMDFLLVPINKIEFKSVNGKKPDISTDIGDVKFIGPLSFVNTLSEIISSNGGGLSDPPNIDVSASGIVASFSIALPTVSVGVMSIRDMSLGAKATLPFIGDPLSFRFNFCERETPFVLTVYIFGGGGFFGITVDPDGIELLEASFEFGLTYCIDLGVASGEAHLMAGIYFKMEGDKVSLTGFVKLGGHLSILGLIQASVEFDLTLTYQFDTGKMWGTATLSIEIDIFMFSFSVDVTVTKQFKGSSGDPTIAQMITEGDWSDYCAAFA